jgi:hypothetical protein
MESYTEGSSRSKEGAEENGGTQKKEWDLEGIDGSIEHTGNRIE